MLKAVPQSVLKKQQQASCPQSHIWVAASAGTGKTKILTDRLLRLLLEGNEPERILAVTFTKAAAYEMEHRLMGRLKFWHGAIGEALIKDLETLGIQATPDLCDRAQGLFNLLSNNPQGPSKGLKIQTVHSLCQSLLTQFPLEAGLNLTLHTLEEDQQELLLKRAAETHLFTPEFEPLWARYEPAYMTDLIIEMIQSPQGKQALLSLSLEEFDLFLERTFKSESLPFVSFDPLTDECPGLMEAIDDDTRYGILKKYLFTLTGTPRQVFVKRPELAAIIEWTVAFQEQQNAKQIQVLSRSFFQGAIQVLGAYTKRKQQLGALDFDDLIHRTLALLSKEDIAPWILYKLDQRLDHILIDEAQDTSPAQWAVLLKMIADFFEGPETFDRPRTVFVVGDVKQSIYSFQGADPAIFQAIQEHLQTQAQTVGKGLQQIDLDISFRSSQAILDVVDRVLCPCGDALFTQDITHASAFPERFGAVELLPTKENLSTYLAKTIKDWLSEKRILASTQKPIQPTDIMILCQKRSNLYYDLVRALRDQGLPVDGPDRYFLRNQLPIQDLCALARFALLPLDNFSLSCLLKGPLFNWNDEDLLALSEASENEFWYQSPLLDKRGIKDRLRALVDLSHQPAGEFFQTLMHQEQIFLKFTQAFGPFAREELEAFLHKTLQSPSTSLQEFLDTFEQTNPELKRQMQTPKGIRLMTVHGSKGLQAPIVILADAHTKGRDRDAFTFVEQRYPLWIPPQSETHRLLETLKEEESKLNTFEHKRLLYVAMTRAEEELYIAGEKTRQKIQPDSWYALISHTLETMLDSPSINAEEGICYTSGHKVLTAEDAVAHDESVPLMTIPPWFQNLSKAESLTVTQSERPAPEIQTQAVLEGLFMHLLLEKQPINDKEFQNLRKAYGDLSKERSQDLYREYQELRGAPHLQYLFQEPYMVELPIAGTIEGKTCIGRIDRLLIQEDQVIIVDYKTDQAPPDRPEDIPEGYRAQLALYNQLVRTLFPKKSVVCQILWTKSGNAMTIPAHLLNSERITDAA